MKIKDIEFRNYKRFVDERKFSFLNSDNQVNDLTLIVGNNGTGKSSILQAIVAMVAPLTRVDLMRQQLIGMDLNIVSFKAAECPCA